MPSVYIMSCSGCKFSPEEEKLVVEMQAKLGNKWAKIASYLPGRTDNDVKNFWSTRQKRLLRALQRPKATADHSATCNGATTYAGSYAMDHNNIDHLGSDAHCFNDFAFQVHFRLHCSLLKLSIYLSIYMYITT